MAIFNKAISKLTFVDLQELLDDKSVENVRLEFKSEVPKRDETLKKLSSFANTLGGLLVVGATGDKDGRLVALNGVPPAPSLKQTIIQWCFDGISPSLDIDVSEPITVPGTSGNVCYVVSVSESEIAPHFLNGRKGIWVRTHEFSSRVQSELATESDVRQLLSRRQLVWERRDNLIARGRHRFAELTRLRYKDLGGRNAGIGARFELSIGPTFPISHLTSQAALLKTLQDIRFDWRQVGFPRSTGGGVVAQHESVLVLRPGSSFSLLEANVWGLLFYATEIEHDASRVESSGIHTYHFIAQLQIFLRHAERVLEEIGYQGALRLELTLKGIQNVPWLATGEFRNIEEVAKSPLDDEASFTLDTTTHVLREKPDGVVLNLLRFVFFAVNWQNVAVDDTKLLAMVKSSYHYNYLKEPNDDDLRI